MRLTEIEVDARPIALARIGLGIATLLNTGEMFALLRSVADGRLALPVHGAIPSPTSGGVLLYTVLAGAAAVALILGWRASGAAALSTALNIWVFLWDQQTYSGHRFLATLLVAYLIFARSDRALSLPRWFRSRVAASSAPEPPAGSQPGQVPWWPQLLMMTQLSVCYFFAAVSKLNTEYLSGAPLAQWIWLPMPWWLFTLTACASIAVELILAVGLWRRSTRREAAVLGTLLHLSILVLMKEQTLPLIAFALTCLSLYGLFFHRPPLPAGRSRAGSSHYA
ncbi:HTTM domain-containing protein [Arthrobacter sp. TMN-37]